MRLLKEISRRYIRFRHGKGYGIHSPFAYMIVRDVINPPYRYYGYDDLEVDISAVGRYKAMRRNLRLVLRLVGRMNCRKVILPPVVDPLLRKAVSLGGGELIDSPDSMLAGSDNILVYMDSIYLTNSVLSQLIGKDGCFILFRGLNQDAELRNCYSTLSQQSASGVVFEGEDAALIAVDSKVSKVKYTINL